MRAVWICAMVLALATPVAAQTPEDGQIKAQSALLLGHRDFPHLNALAAQYRASGARTADGLSKLTLFYAGMEALPMGDTQREELWPAIFSIGENWVKQAPSPAASIALARMHLRYGWEERGANGDPTPEKMAAFREHLRLARQILENSKAVASVDPNWAATLQEIARAEHPVPVPVSSVVALPMTIAPPASHPMIEENARVAIEIKARVAFEHDDYAALNAQALQYRISGAKTPAGIDQLLHFYKGILDYADLQTPSLGGRPNEHQWQLMLTKADRWLKIAPSPAAVIAAAELRENYGWAWRGTGFVPDVRPQDWKPFRINLALAHKMLESHKDASIDPEWYAEMARLAMAEEWPAEKSAALYKEAFARYPDYYPTYSIVAGGLTPKWGGSAEAVEQFADFAVATTRAKEGRSFFARIYQSIQCGCENEVTPDWGKLKPAMDDLVARYPDQWNYHRYAYFACRAGDRATARAVMAKIAYPLPGAWYDEPDQYERCKGWAQGAGIAP